LSTDDADRTLPSLAGAPWLVRPETQAVLAAVAATGHAARAVGGVVRNALLGLAVTDIDIATPARPDAVMAAARAAGLDAVPTGIEHGTVTLVCQGHAYEVTTLRRDVATDGRRATVAFSDDWAEDAARRDFTMNALYCDAGGTVHDPLGGHRDLTAGRVRFIGDADMRIREDFLRILRFFRMHAVYGRGELDRVGLAASVRNRAGLRRISAERVRAELVRLLLARGACDTVDVMTAHGLVAEVLGVAPRPGVLRAATAGEAYLGLEPDAMHRLSALAIAAAEDIPRLANRLRLSAAEREALLVIDAALLCTYATLEGAPARRRLYRLGAERWRREVRAVAALGVAGLEAARRLLGLPEAWPVPVLPVRGQDAMVLGLAPGPDIGAALAEVEDWWVAADFPDAAATRSRLAEVVSARKGQS
jgi:poly(A) polymerase